MIPDNLIFLSAQPDNIYFHWQTEVQIVNFRKFGISDKMHIVIWYRDADKDLPKWDALQKKYPEVRIFAYKDKGADIGLYLSALRPNALKQHFELLKEELNGKVFFYHDSDIIFSYLPDFEKLVNDDVCWQSDCSSYLDYNYLRKKEDQGKMPQHQAVSILAAIGDISVDTIIGYAGKTGGAQMFLKGIDADFWEDVEQMCYAIRNSFTHKQLIPRNITSVNSMYFATEDEGFQSWCADMWAINFALWKRGIKTDIIKELDFSWGDHDINSFKEKPIYHNAGVTEATKHLYFYKGDWRNKSPIGKPVHLPDANLASSQYVKAILDVSSTKIW